MISLELIKLSCLHPKKKTPLAASIEYDSGIILSNCRSRKKAVLKNLPTILDLKRLRKKKSIDHNNCVPGPPLAPDLIF